MNPTRTITTTDEEMNTVKTNPNGATAMNLLQEALSRARMRQPQADTSTRAEAAFTARNDRSARRVAMKARRESARQLGGW
jgi:hypothetical protein